MHIVVHCRPTSRFDVDARGQYPHLRYRVQTGPSDEEFDDVTASPSIPTPGNEHEKCFEVEFDCGSHYLPCLGALDLIGGDPLSRWNVAVFKRRVRLIDGYTPTWRYLTTKLIAAPGPVTWEMPAYHSRVKVAGTTSPNWLVNSVFPAVLGREPIDVPHGRLVWTPAAPAEVTVMTGVYL